MHEQFESIFLRNPNLRNGELRFSRGKDLPSWDFLFLTEVVMTKVFLLLLFFFSFSWSGRLFLGDIVPLDWRWVSPLYLK